MTAPEMHIGRGIIFSSVCGGAYIFLVVLLSGDKLGLLFIAFSVSAMLGGVAISATVVCITIVPTILYLQKRNRMGFGPAAVAGVLIGVGLVILILVLGGGGYETMSGTPLVVWPAVALWTTSMALIFWATSQSSIDSLSVKDGAD